MQNFQSIHAAALEGELEGEPVDITPPRRKTVVEQIRERQQLARERALRDGKLAGRYALVGIGLIVLGSSFGPGWARLTEWCVGVLLASRGLWCLETAAAARREAALDPMQFLGDADR